MTVKPQLWCVGRFKKPLVEVFCILLIAFVCWSRPPFPKRDPTERPQENRIQDQKGLLKKLPRKQKTIVKHFHLETIWQFEVYTDSHQQQLCISFWPTCLIPKIYSPCPVSITLSSAKPCSPLSGSVGVISQLKISPRIASASTKRGPAEQAGEKVAGTIS